MTDRRINPDALRAARKARQLSQDGLAAQIRKETGSLSKRSVAAWEAKPKDGKTNPISARNLAAAARALGVSEAQLSGDEDMRLRAEGRRHAVSALISGPARFSYEMLERRYGLTKEALIEAAPMLFEALNQVFLQKRQAELDALRPHAAAIQRLVPVDGDLEDSEDGFFVDTGEVDYHLGLEEREIDWFRDRPFTLDACPHPRPRICGFIEQLFDLKIPDDILAIDEGAPNDSGLPDYFVGNAELKTLFGIEDDDSELPSEEMCKAAFALVEGYASYAAVAEKGVSDDTVADLAAKVPEQSKKMHWRWAVPDYLGDPSEDKILRAWLYPTELETFSLEAVE